jgi:hypothetical protein
MQEHDRLVLICLPVEKLISVCLMQMSRTMLSYTPGEHIERLELSKHDSDLTLRLEARMSCG